MSLHLGILISGLGSNMQAILSAIRSGALDATAALVLSDRPDAPGLALAAEWGVHTVAISPRDFSSKVDYEMAVLSALRAAQVSHVALAGYMRLVGETLLAAYPHRILNIHPSLLPAFKGLHAQQQALDAGVDRAGCTVHFVDASLDGGPMICQESVPVLPDDTVDALSERILAVEHRLYPQALQWLSENRLRIVDGTVTILPS